MAVSAPVIAYMIVMIAGTRTDLQWWIVRSGQVRAMVLGVEAAHRAHPDKTIVLAGLTSALFEDAIAHSAFYPLGLDSVYLTPGTTANIRAADESGMLQRLVLDPAVMKHAVTHDEVVVYSVIGDHLRNVTGDWERYEALGEPRRIDAGNPLLAYLLGPEWYDPESGIRWMPRRATVRIGGPATMNDRLLLEGFCPGLQLKAGPLHLLVSVEGIPLASTEIGHPDSNFRRNFDMPAALIGRPAVEVAISVDRVIHDSGGRELGLVFGTIAVQP